MISPFKSPVKLPELLPWNTPTNLSVAVITVPVIVVPTIVDGVVLPICVLSIVPGVPVVEKIVTSLNVLFLLLLHVHTQHFGHIKLCCHLSF
jgi:hypothetical protein